MSIENRLAAKKRTEQAAKKRKRNKIFKVIGICMIPVIIALIGYAVFLGVIKNRANTSSYINADGTIDGKSAKSYVTLCDYKNISVNREDHLPTESEVQESIDNTLSTHIETVKEAGTVYNEDSTVNLTFTATSNGTELKDLNYADKAYTLGSKTFTEEFDKAIAKLAVGDEFDFDITFPEDFSTMPIAGMKINFKGKVVSADIKPELTDDFVSEKLSEIMEGSEYPLTAEGFKDFCANDLYTNNVETYVDTYIKENTKVNSYPYLYVKSSYYLLDASYINYVNYYNQQYGSVVYSSPVEMLGLDSRSVYKDQILREARETAAYYLAYQAIFEDAGLEAVTEQDVKDYIAENTTSTYEETIDQYGYNYFAQLTLREKAFDHVMSLVDESGDATQMWKPDTATESDATAK